MRYALLVEDRQGNLVAVGPFPTVQTAHDYEDKHALEGRGVVQVVTQRGWLQEAQS